MKTVRTQGFVSPLVITVILAAAALGGAFFFVLRNGSPADALPTPDIVRGPADGLNIDTGSDLGDANDSEATPSPEGSFQGTGEVLAGTTTPFLDFNNADYEKALREHRVVVLYFYANWCPICRVELSRTEAAFNELELSNVVGFRVSYSDNETDDFEENLARQFGIAYQHTKVILKGGQQVLKNGSTWDKDRYIKEITEAAQ